jgi:hypothetical protein
MFEIVYGFFLLGSFSLGYSLLRIGFPQTQKAEYTKKVLYGYIMGILIFGIPIATIYIMNLEEYYFFLASIVVYILVSAVLFTKRISLKETDPEIIKDKKRKIQIPERAMEKPKPKEKKMGFEHGLMVNARPAEIKKQVFKEKDNNILKALQSKTREMENKNKEKEKNEALERLRKEALQIKEKTEKQTKKKKNELEEAESMDEVEEELLDNMEFGEKEY